MYQTTRMEPSWIYNPSLIEQMDNPGKLGASTEYSLPTDRQKANSSAQQWRVIVENIYWIDYNSEAIIY